MPASLLLKEYLRKLTHLRQGITVYGKAPHKPVLLLALLDGVEKGWITDNRVYVTPELVAAFKENWSLLVRTLHQADFSQPFYYLQTEGFWKLVTYSGKPLPGHIRSFGTLRELVNYGTLDEALYNLLLEPTTRNQLRMAILGTYFPAEKADYWLRKDSGNYLQILENKLLHEPAAAYAAEISVADEEEVFVRSGVFKKLVPKVYNYTCCITGMKVISTYDVSMVDACHVIPFSVSHDDTIGNGLSLCPNLHRAFDRGLISVNDQYQVLVSNSFGEVENHPYSLRSLAGKQLLLPFDKKFYPLRENLAWHRKNVWRIT